MPMYNLIEYCKNYRNTIGSLWNYYRDESVDPITDSESFKFKKIITGKRVNNGNTKEVEFAESLIYIYIYIFFYQDIRYAID